VEAAVRSGDLAAAREAAARMEELVGVAEEASARTPALVEADIHEVQEAHQKAVDDQRRALEYTLGMVPFPEGLPTVAQADLNVARLNEQLEDLSSAVGDSRDAARQAREHAERAAQLVGLLEQGLPPDILQYVQGLPPQEAVDYASNLAALRRNFGG